MPKKIAVKNPGCTFCRYYIAPFEYKGQLTKGACAKGARRVFQPSGASTEKRKWKWVDCAYSDEKNKNRFCEDFQIQSILYGLLGQARLLLKQGGEQLPPAYSREKWWKT
ncbi:MAG: hypothetical protein COB67_05140 [SAR324 cluster bacterium]|uniref:Uncharacterized protein n=1 Tax=SAR324 cluster bacterium TaxID=2024889 RepID=A0A2A4T5S5_9DELT|nr:MAG: hypothetical protein COB67_05140 [SAR324 cluster bacterium]